MEEVMNEIQVMLNDDEMLIQFSNETLPDHYE